MAVTDFAEESEVAIDSRGERPGEVGPQTEGERQGGSAVEISGALARGIAATQLAAHVRNAGSGDEVEAQPGLGEEEVMLVSSSAVTE